MGFPGVSLSQASHNGNGDGTIVSNYASFGSSEGPTFYDRSPCPSLIQLEDVAFGSVCGGISAAKVLHLRCFLVPCV